MPAQTPKGSRYQQHFLPLLCRGPESQMPHSYTINHRHLSIHGEAGTRLKSRTVYHQRDHSSDSSPTAFKPGSCTSFTPAAEAIYPQLTFKIATRGTHWSKHYKRPTSCVQSLPKEPSLCNYPVILLKQLTSTTCPNQRSAQPVNQL